jgi:hypothetical protein
MWIFLTVQQLYTGEWTVLHSGLVHSNRSKSMAKFAGVVDPETGTFPRSTIAYCTDAFSISIGAILGTSPGKQKPTIPS